MRAWTLGFPPAYDEAVRIPGNSKMPGGYAFRTRDDAVAYVREHPREAGTYGPYEIEIEGDDFDASTVDDEGIRVLRVEARLINPDTGEPA